jgi:phosphatidylserine/phosphatidylglycerophosphate/cardiolipin synthase-like enzyme
MNKDTDHLPDRWRRIIQRVARGEDWVPAARAEGCSPSYARVIHTRMMKHPVVVRELDAIRRDARREAVYGVVEAMAQAQKGIDLAERHKNPMAFIKGCELRAKLSGLLIDRVEVAVVDLRGSLEAAKTRVLSVIDIAPLSSEGVLAGSVRWAPRIPGAPVAENPEAGPVEGESVRQVNNVGPENR